MQRNSQTTGTGIVEQLRQSMQPSVDNGTKKATRTIAFGSDGKPYVRFVDVATGQPVSDLTGYQILESGNDMDWLNERSISSSATGSDPEFNDDPTGPGQSNETEEAFKLRNGGEGSAATDGLDSGPRKASDNFGYISTPKVLEYANMVPGPIGTGAKMVNTAINANNVSAVNAAREYIGLPSLSKKEYVGGLIGTNEYDDGLVADVKVNDKVYGVGFEALTKDGRTTLTPEEARRRSAIASSPVKLAQEDESKANKKQFAEDTKNDRKGITGTVKDAVASVGSALGMTFGWSKDETKQVVESSLKQVETGPYAGEAMPRGQVGNVPEMGISDRSTTASKGPAKGGGLASVSRSFNAADSRPIDGTGINWGSVDPRQIDPGMKAVLEQASRQLGFSLNVTSGYRSPERNASVDGAKGSLHQRGKAVDVSLRGLDEGQRQALVGTLAGIAQNTSVRVGSYSGNTGLHVDVGSMPSYDGRLGPAYPMFDRTIAKVDQAPSWFKEGLTPLPDTSRVPTPTFVRDDLEATSVSSRPTSAQTAAQDAMTATGIGAKLGPQSYNSPRQYADMSPQAFLGTEDLDSVPAGMRNNNPGNLKYTGSPWQESNLSGLVGPSTNLDQGDPQARFNSPQAGMDSMARLAVGKYDEGMTTARSIIADVNGWTGGNVRAAENVAATLGVGLDDDLGLREPDKLKGFMQALTLQEHGLASKRYTDDLYENAVAATLFSPQIEAAAVVAQKPTLDDDISHSTPGKLAIGTIERSALAPLNDTKESRQTAIDSRVAGAFDTTAPDRTRSLSMIGSSDNGTYGFAGRVGSPRSIEGSSFSSSNSQMTEKGDRVTGSGSGFAGRAGSARSANENNPSFDRSEGSQATAFKSSGGFAGSAGSARSQNQNNASYDAGSGEGSKATSSTSSSGFAGSAGSARSANQNNADYDGASKSASSTSKGSSGFAGSAGSARSNNQNNSNYDSSQSDSKSSSNSAGNNSGGAKGSNGTNAGSSNKGGLGGWGGY